MSRARWRQFLGGQVAAAVLLLVAVLAVSWLSPSSLELRAAEDAARLADAIEEPTSAEPQTNVAATVAFVDSATLLNNWQYTDHDCASDKGEEKGRGHEKHKEKSPNKCSKK